MIATAPLPHDDMPRLQWEIERFLYDESALLSERRFTEWLELIAQDILYAMPVRTTRMLRDVDKQFLPLTQGAHFDDNRHTLELRVGKLADPQSWSENPPSVPRMAITNVRVHATAVEGEYQVSSNFIFNRTRMEQHYTPLVGWRADLLRRAEESSLGFLLARRIIYLDHTALPGCGVTTFL